MKLSECRGVNGRRISFRGRTYAICDCEHDGEEPEAYSIRSDGGWCALAVIDLSSQPIRPNIYPFVMMTFEWNAEHTSMNPTEIEGDPFGEYDIEADDFVD